MGEEGRVREKGNCDAGVNESQSYTEMLIPRLTSAAHQVAGISPDQVRHSNNNDDRPPVHQLFFLQSSDQNYITGIAEKCQPFVVT